MHPSYRVSIFRTFLFLEQGPYVTLSVLPFAYLSPLYIVLFNREWKVYARIRIAYPSKDAPFLLQIYL